MGVERPRLALVVQRYGEQVTGGSESLARMLAERLQDRYQISVLTSCALDYVTWSNHFPPGEQWLGGVRVLRFPVEQERELVSFNRFSKELYARPRTLEEEQAWLERQGPCVPELVAHLEREHADYHAVVFFTYLYYPTYWGLRAAGPHTLLVPTTHDEPPLGFSLYREVFARPRALAFLTHAEERLVRSRFELFGRAAAVAGIGVDPPPALAPGEFRARHRVDAPYALYAGRIDAGKGCDEMLAFYRSYREQTAHPLDLLLIGKLAMPEPQAPGVRYLGFLPEDEKAAAIAGARVVLCPSAYESLSIALLEGFALGAPALVNARSEVLQDHCLHSNGGLFYQDGDEFAAALERLAEDDALHRALLQGARRYLQEHYRWEVVLERYCGLIEAAAG